MLKLTDPLLTRAKSKAISVFPLLTKSVEKRKPKSQQEVSTCGTVFAPYSLCGGWQIKRSKHENVDSIIRDSRTDGIGNSRGVQSPLLNSWIGERHYYQRG
jgi:hypothetical protein